MKKLITPMIVPFLFLAITFSSCGFGKEVEKAEKVVDEFYTLLSEKDYDKAMEMVDDESLEITSYEDWENVLKGKEKLGKFEGYKKDIGFHTSTTNGVTTVDLNFTCTYEKRTLYEHFNLVKRGDEYKIMMYEYNTDKSKLTK